MESSDICHSDSLHTCVLNQTNNFLVFFMNDLLANNKRFFLKLDDDFWFKITSFLQFALLTYGTIAFFALLLTSEYRKQKWPLIFSQLLLIPLIFYPLLIPMKSIRYFFGLQNTSSFMVIFSRISFYLYKLSHPQEYPPSTKPISWSKKCLCFFTMTAYDLPSRLIALPKPVMPPLSFFVRGLIIVIGLDTMTFLIREWIPHHIKLQNQLFFISLFGGYWVFFCLDIVYWISKLESNLAGFDIGPTTMHSHPIMSHSLGEFWGIRWNPIIGKQLQDSFYKPFRRYSFSRGFCMITCFLGSAFLHAYPQWIASRDLKDTFNMFSFFTIQGIGLVLEASVHKIMRKFSKDSSNSDSSLSSMKSSNDLPNIEEDKETTIDSLKIKLRKTNQKASIVQTHASTNKHEEEQRLLKTISGQYFLELLVMCFVFSICYFFLETPELLNEPFYQVMLLLSFLGLSGYFLVLRVYMISKESPAPSWGLLLGQWIGWIWTLAVIFYFLPLFSHPVLDACEDIYYRSFFMGPIYRILNTFILFYFQQ